MCFFLHRQCYNCGYPDISTIALSSECEDFLQRQAKGEYQSTDELWRDVKALPVSKYVINPAADQARSTHKPVNLSSTAHPSESMATSISDWQAHGKGTVAGKGGDRWNIIPVRRCVQWGILPSRYLCEDCLSFLTGDRAIGSWLAKKDLFAAINSSLAGALNAEFAGDSRVRPQQEASVPAHSLQNFLDLSMTGLDLPFANVNVPSTDEHRPFVCSSGVSRASMQIEPDSSEHSHAHINLPAESMEDLYN